MSIYREINGVVADGRCTVRRALFGSLDYSKGDIVNRERRVRRDYYLVAHCDDRGEIGDHDRMTQYSTLQLSGPARMGPIGSVYAGETSTVNPLLSMYST